MEYVATGILVFVIVWLLGKSPVQEKQSDPPAKPAGNPKVLKTTATIRSDDANYLMVDIPNMSVHPVRLSSIYVPSCKTEDAAGVIGRHAMRIIEKMLTESDGAVEVYGLNAYAHGEFFADIHINGKSVSEILLKHELAKSWSPGQKNPWFVEPPKENGHIKPSAPVVQPQQPVQPAVPVQPVQPQLGISDVMKEIADLKNRLPQQTSPRYYGGFDQGRY